MAAWYDPIVDLLTNPTVAKAGATAGGLGLAGTAYNRLSNLGEQALGSSLDLAQLGLQQTAFQPYTLRSSTGSAFGISPDEQGNLQAAFGLSPEEAALQGQLLGGAGSMFQQAMMPTAQRESDVYSRIRALQQPEEERQRLALEERLASQGRLGVQSNLYGGTPEQLAMSKAQTEAQNQAALMAMQQAQAEQLQQSQLGQQFLASGYIPQAQMQNLLQATQVYPQLAQQAQQAGAGLFGEAAMGGVNALLGSGVAQANMLGAIGGGLLSGAFG